MPKPITGLVAATFTPMHADGRLALDRVPALVEHLLGEGIKGFYAVGSTGEGVLLSGEERKSVAEAYVRATAGRIPVLVQVGHNSTFEACELAAHAQQVGAAGVSATPPFYFKPGNVTVLVDTMAQIAAAAPRLPFYYYHIPILTGVAFDMVEFLTLAQERIPTLAGIKFTSSNFAEMQACLEFGRDRFQIFHGFDEMLLCGLAVGAVGAVGSTYNYAPGFYQRVLAAVARGDLAEARRWQARAVEMVRIVLRYRGLAGQKAMMELIGFDCGPTRLPIVPLDAAERDCLRRELEAIGFFKPLPPLPAAS